MTTQRLIQGDCIEGLRTLPDASVHCCVTSPPYWGLRDYGTGEWQGGDPECDHRASPQQSRSSTLAGNGHGNGKPLSPQLQAMAVPFRGACGKCGAMRVDQQIGLEPTPEAYVARMVEVFREVRRVLREDATLWLNLGDSYASQGGTGQGRHWDGREKNTETQSIRRGAGGTIKPKDLVGIPWRVAFALQADGWWLRQDIVWNKPNPMPESVRDRCTKAHEYVFLLAKAERYYFDDEAISEPASGVSGGASFGKQNQDVTGTLAQSRKYDRPEYATRNRRSVWTISTKPYKGAHFAVMPPALVEPCILAGCPEQCCPACGKGWKRIVEQKKGDTEANDRPKQTAGMTSRTSTLSLSGNGSKEWAERGGKRITLGWEPDCNCAAEGTIRGTVLDPFAGSGTTLAVAAELGRNGIGCELNPEYIELAEKRIQEARYRVGLLG